MPFKYKDNDNYSADCARRGCARRVQLSAWEHNHSVTKYCSPSCKALAEGGRRPLPDPPRRPNVQPVSREDHPKPAARPIPTGSAQDSGRGLGFYIALVLIVLGIGGYLIYGGAAVRVREYLFNLRHHATEVELASHVNASLNDYTMGFFYPWWGGPVSIGGIPFRLASIGRNTGIHQSPGDTPGVQSAPESYSISINRKGVTTVYTLINSTRGDCGARVGELQFVGAASATFVYPLTEGINIRDHYAGGYCNTATDLAGSELYGFDEIRLDMQKVRLPDSFANDTLVKIVLQTPGRGGFPFIAGATLVNGN
jgi:hypothetical protein